MDPTETAEDADHRRHVGNTLMAFSTLGLALGSALTLRGSSGVGFLDGPSALAIGAVTLAVGFGLRNAGRFKR